MKYRHLSLVVLAVSTLLVACGGSSAPKTPEEAVQLVIKAIVEGKADVIRPALPVKADFEAMVAKSGKKNEGKDIDKEIAEELAEIDAKVPKSLTELADDAKAAGLDMATVKVGKIDVEEDVDKEGTELKIKATLTSGDKEAVLKLRAMKLDRGLVMFRGPKLETMSLCKKAIANVQKVVKGVDDPMAKGMAEAFANAGNIEEDCERGIKEKPEQKAQAECMATAADFAALKGCMDK